MSGDLNLLIFRDAKNAEHGKIAPAWNVSGTRDFHSPASFVEFLLNEERFQTGRID
jgi:hypothetical protein